MIFHPVCATIVQFEQAITRLTFVAEQHPLSVLLFTAVLFFSLCWVVEPYISGAPLFRDLSFDDYSAEEPPHTLLDVPFVPSDEKSVDAMLELAALGPKDVLYDLGSGDGRIVVAAAKDWDIRAVGVEMDPLRNEEAKEYAEWVKVSHLVSFVEDDLLSADFSEATVVTMYLLHSVNIELRPRLLNELKPGTRVISHAFDMGAWRADERLQFSGVNIYKWIIPAKVAGTWEWKRADGKVCRVELEQEFQRITGKAWLDGKEVFLTKTKLRGDELDLSISDCEDSYPISYPMRFVDNQLRARVPGEQATSAIRLPNKTT